MKAADAVAVDLAAASGVIDDMEASGLWGSTSPTCKFLANYQTKLASGTTRGEDLRFCAIFTEYMIRKGSRS